MAKELYLSLLTSKHTDKTKTQLLTPEQFTELVINPLITNNVTSLSFKEHNYNNQSFYLNLELFIDLIAALKKNISLKSISLSSSVHAGTNKILCEILEALEKADLDLLSLELYSETAYPYYADFEREICESIGKIHTIKKLSLDDMSWLNFFIPTQNIQSLNIISINEKDQEYRDLENFIKQHSSLIELSNESENGIGDKTSPAAIKNLAKTIKKASLKIINLSQFHYSTRDYSVEEDSTINKISDSFTLTLLTHPTAETLDLSSAWPDCFHFDDSLLKNSKLKILQLNDAYIEDNALMNLANAVRSNSSLVEIEIGMNDFSDKGLLYFLDSIKKSPAQIKKLYFGYLYNVTAQGYKAIAEFINEYPGLEELEIYGHGVIEPNNHSKKADLNLNLPHRLLTFLAEALKTNKTLKILDISEMHFYEIDKDVLAANIKNIATALKLNPNSALTKLDFGKELDPTLQQQLQEAVETVKKNKQGYFHNSISSALRGNANQNSTPEKSKDSEKPELSEKINTEKSQCNFM